MTWLIAFIIVAIIMIALGFYAEGQEDKEKEKLRNYKRAETIGRMRAELEKQEYYNKGSGGL